MTDYAIGDETFGCYPIIQNKNNEISATRLENGVGELLERGGIDLELGLRDLDQHFIVLAAGELTLVLSPLARAATVVQDGDLRARNRSEHGCAGVWGGGGVLGAGACGTVGLAQRFPLQRGEKPMHTCMRHADAWCPTAVTLAVACFGRLTTGA